MPYRQEIVNDLESCALGGIVYSGDVCDLGIFRGSMKFEERHDRDDALGWDIDGEFVFPDGKLLDIGGKRGEKVLAIRVEGGGFGSVFVGWVYDRGVEFTAS